MGNNIPNTKPDNRKFSEIVRNIFHFLLEAGKEYIRHRLDREKENVNEIKSKRLSRKTLIQLEKLKRLDELEERDQQKKCQAQKLVNERAKIIARILIDSGFKVSPEITKEIFNLAESQITGKIKSKEQLKYKIVEIKSKMKLSDKVLSDLEAEELKGN